MSQPHLRNVYDGYLFFRADPLPQQSATWARVERTQMDFTQPELYSMIYDRAFEISAASQYQALSDERRAHVDQLIHDRRHQDPSGDWSCAYVKEHRRIIKDRDTLDCDDDAASMTVILMQRPWTAKAYPRTPMGDLVDLRISPFLNGQGHYGSVATVPGFPAGHTLPHNYSMGKGYQDPRLSSMQERASMACLRKALSDRQPRMMKRSALPEGVRSHFEQDREDEDDTEETDSHEDNDSGCDAAHSQYICDHTAPDNPGCDSARGGRSLREQRSKHDRRLVRSRIAKVFRSQMRVRTKRPVIQKPKYKWIKARQIASKTHHCPSQNVSEDAAHEEPTIIRCQRRNSC